MITNKQIDKLKFEPKNQILAARFTQAEAIKIRQFCIENEIPLSRIIRHAFKQIIPSL
jgi:hypothetical protein